MDGDLSTITKTEFQADQWWKVEFGELVLVSRLIIYNNVEGSCGTEPCCEFDSATWSCLLLHNITLSAEHLQQADVLLTNQMTAQSPDNTWTSCFHSDLVLGEHSFISCDHISQPSAQLAVKSSHDRGVSLREVAVFGYCEYISG